MTGQLGAWGALCLPSPAWFLDMSYSFAMSASFDADYAARFSNPSNGMTTTGLAHLDTSQRVTSQAFTVSINTVF